MTPNLMRDFIVTEETVFLTDLDGTVLRVLHDPNVRRIDRDALIAFLHFNHKYPGQVIPITGRDYEQVRSCFYDKDPPFPVISSNGAELRMSDGREVVSGILKEQDLRFIQSMRRGWRAFAKKHPWLVTEVKRYEIGYHSSLAYNYDVKGQDINQILDKVRLSSESAANLLMRFHAAAKEKGLPFAISKAEQTQAGLSHGNVDKLFAIGWFSSFLPQFPQDDDWSRVVYLGDSLTGNDRQIAKKVRANGGVVIQVLNGGSDRIPDENDLAAPHMAVETVNQLGNLLLRRVAKLLGTTHEKLKRPENLPAAYVEQWAAVVAGSGAPAPSR